MKNVRYTKLATTDFSKITPYRRQRGDFLLESLIGMVLMAIIGMGVVFVTSKVTTSQKDMRMQEIVVNKLRTMLIRNGTDAFDICTDALGFTLPNGDTVAVTTQGCNSPTSAVINGFTVAGIPKPIFLKATSANKSIDEIVVGGTWQPVN